MILLSHVWPRLLGAAFRLCSGMVFLVPCPLILMPSLWVPMTVHPAPSTSLIEWPNFATLIFHLRALLSMLKLVTEMCYSIFPTTLILVPGIFSLILGSHLVTSSLPCPPSSERPRKVRASPLVPPTLTAALPPLPGRSGAWLASALCTANVQWRPHYTLTSARMPFVISRQIRFACGPRCQGSSVLPRALRLRLACSHFHPLWP